MPKPVKKREPKPCKCEPCRTCGMKHCCNLAVFHPSGWVRAAVQMRAMQDVRNEALLQSRRVSSGRVGPRGR